MDFEADKIVALLQYCCWKERCEMDKNGFRAIGLKILNGAERKHRLPDERYLGDLLKEARQAVQQNKFISRQRSYIDVIAQFSEIGQWEDWLHHLSMADEYINADFDLSKFPALETAICFPAAIEKNILPTLSPIRKTAACTLNLLSCPSEATETNLDFVLKALETFPLLIWVIPVTWKDRLAVIKDPGWEEVTASRRIVPVWLEHNSAWGKAPLIPWLKPHQTIGNLPGLLTAVLHTQEVIKKYHKPPETVKPHASVAGRIQNVQNNRGTFFLGDNLQIKGENFFQGTVHQTIYKHKNDDHEH